MNDFMSVGMHRVWKNQFVRKLKPRPGQHILDMAGGTGDIAFRIAERGAQVTVADINPEMLAVGPERANRPGIEGQIWAEEKGEGLSFPAKSLEANPHGLGT